MVKGSSTTSVRKITFGKKKLGVAKKSFNKHYLDRKNIVDKEDKFKSPTLCRVFTLYKVFIQ